MNARLVHCCHSFRAGAVATAITALALAPVTKATEQLTNRSFEVAGGVGWSVEPYTSPTPPYTAWEPFAVDGEVNLYRKYPFPEVPPVKMLWQVLDISNVGGVAGTASVVLKRDFSSFAQGAASSTTIYLEYLDGSGITQQLLLLRPDNYEVPQDSVGMLFSTSFSLPADAQKITGFNVYRTYGGPFYALEFSLDLQPPAPQLPAIAVENYGTPLTSNSGHSWMGQSVVGVPASTVTFTVKNTGTGPLTLSEVTVEGTDAGDFGVTQPDVTSVPPQESTTFTVTFTPSAADERLATLNIVSNDTPNSPFIINLTGYGMMPMVTLTSPTAESSFPGGAAIALEAAVESFGASISKVEFYDGETLIGTGVSGIDGYWFFPDESYLNLIGDYVEAVYDAPNGCMYWSTSGSFTSPLTWQGTLYSSVLETEFQAAIDFTHGPDNTLNAQLSGTDGQSVTLTGGSGMYPKYTLSWPHASAGTHELTARVFYGAEQTVISDPVTINVEATPVIGVEQPADTALTSGSSSVDFGSSYPGVPLSLDFTVKNTGNATLNDILVTVEGANAGDYALTTTPADSLLEGKAMTFTVTFTPSTIGALPATLSIASNDPTNTTFTISLLGYGMDPPQVTLTSPLDGASFATGDVIALEAMVETFGGSVTGLEFYDGETLIGSGQIGLYGGWSYPDGCHLAVMAGESGYTIVDYSTPDGMYFFNGQNSPEAPLQFFGTLSQYFGTSGPGGVDFSFGANNTLDAEIYGMALMGSRTLTGGTCGNPRFTLSWPDASAGTHMLTARAYYGSDQSVISVPVTINVGTAPVIAVEQADGTPLTSGTSAIHYGATYPGIVLSRTFSVRNTGSDTLSDIAVSLDGTNSSDFVVTSSPASSVPIDNATTFTVTFTPSGPGLHSATLSIASNDMTNTPFTIDLSGSGLDLPQVTLTRPLDGASFATGEVIALEATVETFGGSVTGLEFYDGETLIGSGQIGLYGGWSYPDGSHLAVRADEAGNTIVDYSTPDGMYLFNGQNTPEAPLRFFGTLAHWNGVSMDSGNGGVDFSFGANSTLDAEIYGMVLMGSRTLTGGTSDNPKYTLSWPDASDGTHVLTARVRYGAGDSMASAPASISIGGGTGHTPFQAWMIEKGVLANANPEQMPNGDGVTNLTKFAFNMDPKKPDSHRLKAGNGELSGLPGASRVGGKLRIEFLRRKAGTNPGITYTPQFGPSPGALSDFAGTATSVDSVDTTWERVVVEDPVAGSSKRFGCLKVEQNP